MCFSVPLSIEIPLENPFVAGVQYYQHEGKFILFSVKQCFDEGRQGSISGGHKVKGLGV